VALRCPSLAIFVYRGLCARDAEDRKSKQALVALARTELDDQLFMCYKRSHWMHRRAVAEALGWVRELPSDGSLTAL
jgi:hypothetical protein